MQVTVHSNAGPFTVTCPSTAVTWSNLQTVTWDVAGTASDPINATNVNILLSTNGGLAFPIMLASNVPNGGFQTVQLPNLATSRARIEVQAAGNIFFAISRSNFTLIGLTLPVQSDRTIDELTELIVTNSASEGHIPAPALTYQLVDPPAGASIDTNGVITWTPSQAQGPSTNLITTVVTDSGAPPLSATNSFIVVVNDLSRRAPVLAPIADQTIVEGNTLIITNSVTGPGAEDPLTFSLATTAPAGATINPTNGLFSWTPTEAQGPGTNLITVTLMDASIPGWSESQSFTVTVLETNSPPVLAPILDRVIHAGTTLSISNTATDPDIPANILTLGPGAPPGAAINASNGLLVWTTSDADANTTNLVAIRVSDDGSPSLSDTKTFTVTVVPRPTFAAITLSNALVTLTWSAVPGQTYRVQYQDMVTGTNWIALPPDVTASGASAATSDVFDSAAQRFYRVMLLP
jgi:hypothetical protein